jgi:hypothetical protein
MRTPSFDLTRSPRSVTWFRCPVAPLDVDEGDYAAAGPTATELVSVKDAKGRHYEFRTVHVLGVVKKLFHVHDGCVVMVHFLASQLIQLDQIRDGNLLSRRVNAREERIC